MLTTGKAFFIVIMEECAIDIQYRARYYKLGSLTPSTRAVWFVLHGYGQLARFFLSKFKVLEEAGICVIAPEGLSRFYTEDLSTRLQTGNNRVGATWMTREGRDTDIHNYIHYLTTIYQQEIGDASVPVTILGFSQGAATASRWAASGAVAFRELVLWAGVFPPDMDFAQAHAVLASRKVTLVYGDTDPFLTEARKQELQELIRKLNLTPALLSFPGGHEMDAATLRRLI